MDLPEREAGEVITMAIRALNEASDDQGSAKLLAYAQVRATIALASAVDRLAGVMDAHLQFFAGALDEPRL